MQAVMLECALTRSFSGRKLFFSDGKLGMLIFQVLGKFLCYTEKRGEGFAGGGRKNIQDRLTIEDFGMEVLLLRRGLSEDRGGLCAKS